MEHYILQWVLWSPGHTAQPEDKVREVRGGIIRFMMADISQINTFMELSMHCNVVVLIS